MLIYNLFVFFIALLLYLDFLSEQYNVKIGSRGNRFSLNNVFIYLAILGMILFSGFRFEIGYDYNKYFSGYLTDSELVVWEPLFVWLTRFTREINFGLDFQAVLLYSSIITYIVLYKALKNLTPHYRLGLFIYLLIPSMYLSSFSVIRQGIALVILLYGFQYITYKVDHKKYALFVLLAFMFHYSSIFVVFVYIIGSRFFRQNHSWILYTLLIIISFFFSFIHVGKLLLMYLPGHFSAYANFAEPINVFKLIVVNLFFLFFMSQKDHFLKSQFEHYLLNSLFVGLLIFNIFSDFLFVSRLAQYFLVLEIILVPIYLYSLKDAFMRNGMLVLFVLYYLLQFNYTLQHSKDFKYSIVPYKNYFLEEDASLRHKVIKAWLDYYNEYYDEIEKSRE